MTELQAWTIFVVEPLVFTLLLVAVILAYDKLFPCDKKTKTRQRDSTGRSPSMPTGEQERKRTRPYKRSPEMLDETDK